MVRLFTIGYTKKSAEEFFSKIRNAHVKRILDIRLNNSSQLAGFTKRPDFEYFLKEIGGIDYLHLPELCPTKEIFEAYREHTITWQEFEKQFVDLLKQRRIEDIVDKELLDHACLLCSEDKPDHCHRRLVGQYLSQKPGNLELVHL
jgi:uncharacterized protein (DUF488 family)